MKYWILILMLQDPAHSWHPLRAAVFSTEKLCNDQGAKVVAVFGQGNSYFCFEAEYPY